MSSEDTSSSLSAGLESAGLTSSGPTESTGTSSAPCSSAPPHIPTATASDLPGSKVASLLLQPATSEELRIEINEEFRQCSVCRRTLPIKRFVRRLVKSGRQLRWHRDPRCNICRVKANEMCPRVLENAAVMERMKQQPCKDCGNTFTPDCMELVHARDLCRYRLSSSYRWMGCKLFKQELLKFDAVCACCAKHRASLADVQLIAAAADIRVADPS